MAVRLDNDVTNEEFRDFIQRQNLEMEDTFREKYMSARLKFCTGISIISKGDRSLDPATAVSNANLARKVAKEMEDTEVVLFDSIPHICLTLLKHLSYLTSPIPSPWVYSFPTKKLPLKNTLMISVHRFKPCRRRCCVPGRLSRVGLQTGFPAS